MERASQNLLGLTDMVLPGTPGSMRMQAPHPAASLVPKLPCSCSPPPPAGHRLDLEPRNLGRANSRLYHPSTNTQSLARAQHPQNRPQCSANEALRQSPPIYLYWGKGGELISEAVKGLRRIDFSL